MEIGEVARVGTRGVPASLVAAVAHAQGVAPRVAVDELIEDALLAEAAPSFRVTDDPAVQFACAAALARSVALHLAAAAKEEGLPTDNELGMVQVAHALVPRSGPATDRARIAMATAIRQAVSGSTSADDFKRRTEAVPHAGMILKIEMVPPFGADGKMSDGGEIDPSFVAAAFALSSTQTISPVIETPFGWHVLRLVEHTAPDSHGLEDRRRALSDAVASMRARWALDTLLRERRERTDVSVAAAADSLTALTAAVPANQP
jgi:PPIC-type peptidyl-prolyl cis-trans isomerase-like protein